MPGAVVADKPASTGKNRIPAGCGDRPRIVDRAGTPGNDDGVLATADGPGDRVDDLTAIGEAGTGKASAGNLAIINQCTIGQAQLRHRRTSRIFNQPLA